MSVNEKQDMFWGRLLSGIGLSSYLTLSIPRRTKEGLFDIVRGSLESVFTEHSRILRVYEDSSGGMRGSRSGERVADADAEAHRTGRSFVACS